MTLASLQRLAGSAPATKHYRLGTERTVSPQRTLERLRPMLPAMGITRMGNVTGLDRIGIPVVMVTRPNSRSLAVFQGKGVELAAAQVSGIMEAIETWHAENIQLPLRWQDMESLAQRNNVLDPRTLPQSASCAFHPRRNILWIEGRELLQDQPIWVPFDAVHADFSAPGPPGGSGLRPGTNGLAGGNHPLEALMHALCEVIERDATTLWNFSNERHTQTTEIDLDTVTDEVVSDLIQKCRTAELSVRAWDVTSDVGVPCFVAELHELSEQSTVRWHQPTYGSGCHVDSVIALARALTEAVQARTTFISGARDDMSWGDYEQIPTPPLAVRGGSPNEPPLLRFCSVRATSESLNDDLQSLIERLVATNLQQVIAVDLTSAEFGVPVMRALVPGLEGPDEDLDDFVPGARLRQLLGEPT